MLLLNIHVLKVEDQLQASQAEKKISGELQESRKFQVSAP